MDGHGRKGEKRPQDKRKNGSVEGEGPGQVSSICLADRLRQKRTIPKGAYSTGAETIPHILSTSNVPELDIQKTLSRKGEREIVREREREREKEREKE